MKMWVFIREIVAGASIIILASSIPVLSHAQVTKAPRQVIIEPIPSTDNQNKPLTLKFDGIDLASFEKASENIFHRDIYSRVRSAVRRDGVQTNPAEMDRATHKIITLLKSEYVRTELAKNSNARITINVDLTFQPLTTEATFKF